MKQAALARWLRIAAGMVAVMGVVVCVLAMPGVGFHADQPLEPTWYRVLYSVSVWILAAPCYIALAIFLRIVREIGRDNSFCHENAARLRVIGILALCDTGAAFIAIIAFFLLDILALNFLPLGFCLIVAGLGIAVVSFTLSHLVDKAVVLKEENDGTI
ncbi:MAG: DUF2975 domain-containing protein [Clostridiales bacterium]|jgi:hypothetical protein|nr:DUF2975 domain-containing protein [Clostridiales bacterium]